MIELTWADLAEDIQRDNRVQYCPYCGSIILQHHYATSVYVCNLCKTRFAVKNMDGEE